tara:strand:+ start:228 stop:2312 length:2085 start_codon:yes stop_codon:yes gene_type:complete
MANNYTVSSLETPTGIIETPGDNVYNSTPTYVLTITPDAGYSVTSTSFTASSLPTEINSVTFSQNGELVVATVNFASNFVMPTTNVNLTIDIDGSAELKNYTIAGTYSTVQTNTTTSAVSNVAYNNSGNYTTSEVVLTKTFAASSTSGTGFSGYYFEEEPYISFSSVDLFYPLVGRRYSVATSKVYNAANQLTSKTFNISYTYPSKNHSGDSLIFTANAVKIYDEALEIKSYEIVKSTLSKFGESRALRVYGTPGSKFDLTITKTGGDTYNFTSDTFTSSASYEDDKAVPSLGYYEYDILFPGGTAADDSITQDTTYTIVIAAGTSTTLSLQSPLQSTFDIKQLLDKSVTIRVAPISGYTISTLAPIIGPVGETDPVLEFNNVFTIAYSSAINILSQPTVDSFISTPSDPGNTDVAFSDVTLAQGATNTVNLTIPKSYIYEFGNSNVVYELNASSLLSTATNTQPVATAQTLSAISAVGTTIQLAGTDAEGSTLTFTIASNPTSGTLTNFNTATGQVVYTSNSSYSGSDSFTFTVNDGGLTSTAATVGLTIGSQAVAPTSTEAFSYRDTSGSYSSIANLWASNVSYVNLTTGSSNITVSVDDLALDSIHTGWPSYANGLEDVQSVDYVFKHGATELRTGYLNVNASNSSASSFGATLNFSNFSIIIPSSHNSGSGLISGGSYTLEIKLTYQNNS